MFNFIPSGIERKRKRLSKLLDAECDRALALGRSGVSNFIIRDMLRVQAGQYDYQLDTMILEARAA